MASLAARVPAEGLRQLLIGAGLLAALLVIGLIIVPWIRRRYHGEGGGSEGAIFDIERLEAMRRRGEMSDEEFRKLRRVALGLDAPGENADNPTATGGRATNVRPEGPNEDGDAAEGDTDGREE